MNKIIEALKQGKEVYFVSPEPRFYKLVNGELMYSDDLREWKTSNGTLDIFKNEDNWSIR